MFKIIKIIKLIANADTYNIGGCNVYNKIWCKVL